MDWPDLSDRLMIDPDDPDVWRAIRGWAADVLASFADVRGDVMEGILGEMCHAIREGLGREDRASFERFVRHRLDQAHWASIYDRLERNAQDLEVGAELLARVRRVAERALRAETPEFIDTVVSDACAYVLGKLDSARARSDFGGFVWHAFRSARRDNLRIKARARRLDCVSLDDGADHQLGDDTLAPDRGPAPDELELLRACLDTLPERERTVVVCSYLEEMSRKQIVDVWYERKGERLTPSHCGVILHRAIAQLQNCATQAWRQGRP